MQGNEDPSLANTVAPPEFGQPPEFKFTAEPVPRINPNWSGLEEWKKQQGGGASESAPPSDPPYTTPGPPKINEPPPGFTHSGGMSTMALVPFYNPTTGEEWMASSGGWSPAPGWVQGSKPADWKPPENKKEEGKKDEPGKEPKAPKPPTFINMDPLKGLRETFVPRNLLGQTYDPKVREDYEKDVDKARPNFYQRMRGQSYANPVYQTPTIAVPQTQFGGYGQPMPMAPLAPYAGLGGSRGMYAGQEEEEEPRPGGPSRDPSDGVY